MSASSSPSSAPPTRLWRRVGLDCVSDTIWINLDFPVDPFVRGSRPAWGWGRQTGSVFAQLRCEEELYIDSELFRVHLEPDQASPGILGRELRARYGQRPELHFHVNVLRACAQARLFPRSLCYPDVGTRLLYAWGNGFINDCDEEFVCGVSFWPEGASWGEVRELAEPWTQSCLAASVG